MKALRLAVVSLLAAAVEAAACVGCREPGADTVAAEPQTVLAGVGFSWGVILFLAVAFSIVGSLSVYIARVATNLDRANATGVPAPAKPARPHGG